MSGRGELGGALSLSWLRSGHRMMRQPKRNRVWQKVRVGQRERRSICFYCCCCFYFFIWPNERESERNYFPTTRSVSSWLTPSEELRARAKQCVQSKWAQTEQLHSDQPQAEEGASSTGPCKQRRAEGRDKRAAEMANEKSNWAHRRHLFPP